MATQDFAYIRYLASTGVAKVLPVSKSMTCDLRPTPLTQQQIAQLIDEPQTPEGYTKQIISCSGDTWPTYADAQNSGYTEVVDPTPEQPTGDYGQTRIATGNVDILSPVVEWQNGKARYRNTATFDVPQGKNVYYFESGQTATTAISDEYRFLPGDEVNLLMAVSDSPNPYVSYFFRNASAKINIGNAPS